MVARNAEAGIVPDAWTATPLWNGDPLDLSLAVDMFLGLGEGLPLLTSDAQIRQYDVEIINAGRGDSTLSGHRAGRPRVPGAYGKGFAGTP